MKNQKGITLITLIVTIIVIIILASIATYSGVEVINTSQFTAFSTELKIMQTQVNAIYQKYQNSDVMEVKDTLYYGKEKTATNQKSILELGQDLTAEQTKLLEKLSKQESSGVSSTEGYRYWNQELLTDLNIDGITQEFLVNLAKRSIVSTVGFKYDDEMYYTIKQLPDSIYNVEFDNQNLEEPTFTPEVTQILEDKWEISLSDIKYDGYISKWQVQYKLDSKSYWNTTEDLSFTVNTEGKYLVKIINGEVASKEVEVLIEKETNVVPEQWEVTSKEDKNWYSYSEEAKACGPNLLGEMTPIKYVGEIIPKEQNQWANAITKDGSMFVWIPRFAYRITKGYHSNEAGTIEVAFIDKDNKFLNGDSKGIAITDKPSEVTYTGDVQDQWLVHPAFTSDANIGGGFGEAGKGIEGFWVGKFEATGEYNSETETGTLSVKPGITALGSMTINQQFKLAKSSQFGESITAEKLGSHMAKNSEWGAVAYLAHSKYGAKNKEEECGQQIARNTNSDCYTGGSNNIKTIYITNKNQSTTYNATGVYDMVGGAYEYVASYGNFTSSSNLTIYGGDQEGDLCDTATRGESTAYKTVYAQGSSDSNSLNYEANSGVKGDAIYETSSAGNVSSTSWFSEFASFPDGNIPFFGRGGYYYDSERSGTFLFGRSGGNAGSDISFRVALAGI